MQTCLTLGSWLTVGHFPFPWGPSVTTPLLHAMASQPLLCTGATSEQHSDGTCQAVGQVSSWLGWDLRSPSLYGSLGFHGTLRPSQGP